MKRSLTAIATLSVLTLLGCSPATRDDQRLAQVPAAEPDTATDIYQDYLNRDVRDDVFYFVLPDRFNNGDVSNDNGNPDKPISYGGLDLTSKWAFHGGDIKGLEEKLDYLQDMGITAIWMTPILRNKAIQEGGFAHHGYWIVDFTELDPHFGTNAELKQLIDAAHERGMKIFFDIITNHTADVIRYTECHNPDGSFIAGEPGCAYKSMEQVAAGDTYTPFVPEQEASVKVPEWLNDPAYYNNQGDSFWEGESAINGDFAGLDDLNTRDPRVVDGFIDIYKNLITAFKPDGFRIDTVKHVDMSFWQKFGPAIVEHAQEQGIPQFHIFGEVYDPTAEVLSRYTTEGKLPSVLDFGFQRAAASAFVEDKGADAVAKLFADDDFYNDADSQADLLMNFLGNHDMGRLGHFIDKANPDASEEERLARAKLAHAFMFFSRGVPVIYYGDEQGFTGDGGDVDAREDMFPSHVAVYNDNQLIGTNLTTEAANFDPTHPLYNTIQTLAEVRKSHTALRRGITYMRGSSDDNQAFAMARVAPTARTEYLVAFNPSDKTQQLQLPALAPAYLHVAGENQLEQANATLTLQLPPFSYAVYKGNQPLPSDANLAVTFEGIDKQDDRVTYRFDLPGAKDNPVPLYVLSVEMQTALGSYELMGHDATPPYTLSIHPDTLAELQPRGMRLTVSNMNGMSQSTLVTFPRPRKATQD
ncbi:alpha-amylase [Aestuariibacter halophilus]|uniref:Alpha-amylase n=1 Tax=Fluctibacter halophilus TaxID=226011 RepID=A0ABS8GBF2_9ALTE|nr:alpha-amylase family glycosyl hydrolase [Aestuariibacter halophilus]MCC2617749.1 alpha-amylase [Aestuariibacter halophilus]